MKKKVIAFGVGIAGMLVSTYGLAAGKTIEMRSVWSMVLMIFVGVAAFAMIAMLAPKKKRSRCP